MSRPPPGPPPAASAAPVAASSAAVVDELDRPLALDTRVTHGRLANGLTYYVLPHRKPERRAQMWLVVNAGSVLEDEDQRGLAHLVEHMAFNGTRRFPEHALTNFLEKSGVRFGADLNASTGFDETTYTLQVPTDDGQLFDGSLRILRDFADGVSFDPAEVEKERPVVLEEWRLGRGAQMRLFDKQAPVLFQASKYAERLPIGKPEIITRAPRDALLRFYRDWYRPELMALVAVGDFDGQKVEARIREEFASLAAPSAPRPRELAAIPPHSETRVSVETDREMPVTSVAMVSKLPHRPRSSARDYRRTLGENLFSAMLGERLDESSRKNGAAFLRAGAATSALTRSSDQFVMFATAQEGMIQPAFSALLQEFARVERHGFTAGELERAKARLMRRFENAAQERDKLDSRHFAAEISRHFLEQEAMPGVEAELSLVQRFLPTLTLEELNRLGATFAAGSRVVLVTGPESMPKPAAEELLALERALKSGPIDAYSDGAADLQDMPAPAAAGTIVQTKTRAELGITEWTLSNGARVVLKPTTFKNAEVRMGAYSPGGTSLVKDQDYDSARFADDVLRQSGLGTHDAVALRRAFAGKLAQVSANLGELEESLTGSASSTDLLPLFQLIYWTMTAPRRDEAAFAVWRARATELARHRLLSPETTFFDRLQRITTQDHLRRRPITPELLARVDLDKALAIFKDRFADASDFNFVFVGNFTLEQLKPFVENYLAALPARRRKETWRDVGVRWPRGIKTETLKMGTEPKSRVQLTFHGQQAFSREIEASLRVLREALRLRLREVLREDLGGVYGVNLSSNFWRRPRQEYSLTIEFGCQPENVKKLQAAVFDEIRALQEHGIDESYLVKIREARRRSNETDLQDNAFWLRDLLRIYSFGEDPVLIGDISRFLGQATPERVRDAAKRFLSSKQYVLGVLEPESTTGAAVSVP